MAEFFLDLAQQLSGDTITGVRDPLAQVCHDCSTSCQRLDSGAGNAEQDKRYMASDCRFQHKPSRRLDFRTASLINMQLPGYVRASHGWSVCLAATHHLSNIWESMFLNALNSRALSLGSSRNIVACSPGRPLNLVYGSMTKRTPFPLSFFTS